MMDPTRCPKCGRLVHPMELYPNDDGCGCAPRRIQRQRTKGWRAPDTAIYVGRPTRWGNPFRVVKAGREPGLFGGTVTVYTVDGPGQFFKGTDEDPKWAAKYAVNLYRRWINGSQARCENLIPELRGHDLMCWCPLDQPCHADVLLEIANA